VRGSLRKGGGQSDRHYGGLFGALGACGRRAVAVVALVQLFGARRSGTTWARAVLERNYRCKVVGGGPLPGEVEAFKHLWVGDGLVRPGVVVGPVPYRVHPLIRRAIAAGVERRVRAVVVVKSFGAWWWSARRFMGPGRPGGGAGPDAQEWEHHKRVAAGMGLPVLRWDLAVAGPGEFVRVAGLLGLRRRRGRFDMVPGYVRRTGEVLDRTFRGQVTGHVLAIGGGREG